MRNEKLLKLENYILYLFSFAFLGWVMETIFCLIVLGHFEKRGFLYGPVCPIYGFGVIILIVFLSKYQKNPFKIFTLAIIIFSIFEYVVSYVLEVLFNSYWWDYTYDFMNLNGRIAIFYSLVWGFIALIFIKLIYPHTQKLFNKITKKIPQKYIQITLSLIGSIFIIDFILSCVKYLS